MSDQVLKDRLLVQGEIAVKQGNQIDNIIKITDDSQQLGDKVKNELHKQGQQLQKNIKTTNEINYNVNRADRITQQMIAREYCIKFLLWLVILILFVAIIVILALKLNNSF